MRGNSILFYMWNRDPNYRRLCVDQFQRIVRASHRHNPINDGCAAVSGVDAGVPPVKLLYRRHVAGNIGGLAIRVHLGPIEVDPVGKPAFGGSIKPGSALYSKANKIVLGVSVRPIESQ